MLSIHTMLAKMSLRDPPSKTNGPATILVVSDCHAGSTVAGQLAAHADVRLVTDRTSVARHAPDGVSVEVGDPTAIDMLRAAGADEADTGVVAMTTDRRNLLATQLLRTRFGVDDVTILLNDPQYRDAIDDVATRTICGSSILASALRTAVESSLQRTETV